MKACRSKMIFSAILAFSGFWFPLELTAQQFDEGKQFGIFNSKEEYHQFMGNAKKVAYGPNGNAELQAMIPFLNDVALNKPIGTTAGAVKTPATSIGMLANKSIRNEIELVDDQYEELKAMNAKIQNRVAKEIMQLDFSKTKTVTTRIKAIRKQAREELESLLLPHQLKRLRQLEIQSALRKRSLAELLAAEPYRTTLDLSDLQVNELKKEELEINAELEKEIRKLREAAREKLLSSLTTKQEKQARDLLGDAFEFEDKKQFQKGETKTKIPGQLKKQRPTP